MCAGRASASSAVLNLSRSDLPSLDCHAHIAPSVTPTQLESLGSALIFAVTRSLDEADSASGRADTHLVWGCGVHPGVPSARAAFDEHRFECLVDRFALVGEVGLDRRTGGMEDQVRVFSAAMRTIREAPVLVSVHSAGCAEQVVEIISGVGHPGGILHWFLGSDLLVRRAASSGCYFSVNGAMSEDVLRRIPPDRILPETDFPAATRRGGGTKPGDTRKLEERVAGILGLPIDQIRRIWYRNLRDVAVASGAIERLPASLVDVLLDI